MASFLPFTDNYGVAQLYRRIISPSVKVQNEECQKQTHYRHTNYKSQSPVNRLKMASPVHSVASAPGHLEAHDLSLQVVLRMSDIFFLFHWVNYLINACTNCTWTRIIPTWSRVALKVLAGVGTSCQINIAEIWWWLIFFFYMYNIFCSSLWWNEANEWKCVQPGIEPGSPGY